MEIINLNSVKRFITKDTSIIREILSPRNSSLKNQSLAEATVLPGKSTAEHYHLKTEEIYYILRGQGKIFVEDEERMVKPGDGVVILPGKRHKICNIGNEDLVFLCCCAPSYEDDDTVVIHSESG